MKRAWQIACVAFVAFAMFWLIVSFEYPYKDRLGPGPGFFPFWLSIITGTLALALLFQVSLAKSSEGGSAILFPERQGAMRILVILVALVGSLALLDPLGFRISLFLFLLFLPFALGERTWWVTLIFAAAGSFGIFHVFYYWLKVPLPVGVFGI
jgi:putative tricarboxylic transport membrane protein